VANRAKVSEEIWKDMIDGFNEEVKGVESQIWMHFCFGGAGGSLRLNCIETMKHLGDCDADVIQVEAGSSRGEFLDAELSNWNEYCPDKDFAVGVVTPLTLMGETLESVAEIIRKGVHYVPPERLAVTTDEGFREISRRASLDKLGLMAEAARLVRGEGYSLVPKTKVVSLVEAS
jgi:methionine synthase II (cobalamin-independent)